MGDRKGDKAKQPPECKPDQYSGNPCPHLMFDQKWEGERYSCERCGEHFYLDYEEMK